MKSVLQSRQILVTDSHPESTQGLSTMILHGELKITSLAVKKFLYSSLNSVYTYNGEKHPKPDTRRANQSVMGSSGCGKRSTQE